jgi:lipid-binding SYLF domain-containing protein
MKRIIVIILALVLVQVIGASGPALASDAQEAKQIVEKSKITFEEFVGDKNFNWLQENMHKAKGILIFPEVLKAGFFWGGSGGTGVLLVRDEKTGAWSQPAFYTVGSVTFGLQIGAESAEVVMLAMSQKAIDSLFASSFKLGGEIAVAAGPFGAGVNKTVTADFISFAKAKGLYTGLNFEGSVVAVRDSLNKGYYGKEVRPLQIIVKKEVSNPVSEGLLGALKKAAH